MSKTLSVTLLLIGVLLVALIAQAKGPKTPITVTSDSGVVSGTVSSLTLCAASPPISCTGKTFACSSITVTGPSSTIKTSCGPAPFKVAAYSASVFVISTTAPGGGGCFITALAGTTSPCTAGSGTISVFVK